ncbi:hypothetical protein [Kitasatospora griseola]|uniref:hypothetical protein n=1 Tax=Kitasatospora griseola TaxID=2064 RepID=UPI00166FD80E|nr:hypothetical protein [Kitasatospora griseola]GGQ72267.1 hypothetical protein GCM10010195_30000 [Kitasatospora griseola]
MTGTQFGFRPEELLKIMRDFEQLNQRMAAMTKQVGHIKATVAKAAATDVFSGAILGVVGAGAVLAEVKRDVDDISHKADALLKTKEKLTHELGQDAAKIKKMIERYHAVEQGVADIVGKPGGEGKPQPKSPSTGIAGVGNGGGGGTGGGGSHPEQPKSPSTGGDSTGGHGGGGTGGGGHAPQPKSPNSGGGDTSGSDGSGISTRPGGLHDGPKIKDRSSGDWKTTMINGTGWDDWSRNHKWHPRNGQGGGVVDRPNLDGVSDERKAMVERAMERVERKLGYSQGAVTNGYRVDCSGFVSAAWGLSTSGGGTSTGPLISESAGIAHHINKSDLMPGDALVIHHESGDQNQHVVLFGGWADAAHTKAIILEDSGSNGCISHEVAMSKLSGYTAIRKNGM